MSGRVRPYVMTDVFTDARPYVIADVFTDAPLEGNQVAVFTDATGLGDDVMQRMARELNLSETVFLLPARHGAADARARIFTPTAELPFAGHPVLGTAFVLAEGGDSSLVRLAAMGPFGANCFAGRGTRVKTRMFAPGLGVAEDPATGSAAGPLALHLVRHGWSEFGADIEIRQGAEIGRPSVIHTRVEGSPARVTRMREQRGDPGGDGERELDPAAAARKQRARAA